MSDDDRNALRTFLKERRARLKPSDVGLPSYGTRRCPGLRREEVAALVGVSADWYTLFEMARCNRRASIRMIERVAVALRLDEEDHAKLLCLAVPELARVSSFIVPKATRVTATPPDAERSPSTAPHEPHAHLLP
jgi:transcriptional regulator with XRE-family HTH domain